MGDSKSEYLKRYTEQNKSRYYKRVVKDVTVKYVSGDLPETLDGFEKFGSDACDLFKTEDDEESKPTVVRQGTLQKQKKCKDLDKTKKEEELEAKYDVWNKGIKTLEETYQKLKQEEYERSKPLARYADDTDLTEQLKSKIHSEDPMANYFSEKAQKKKEYKKKMKKKNHKHDDSSESSESEQEQSKFRYKGPEPPPNRYGIWPGYRWDGVNRSNGFEEKIVEEQTSCKLNKEIAQQWSMEDM